MSSGIGHSSIDQSLLTSAATRHTVFQAHSEAPLRALRPALCLCHSRVAHSCSAKGSPASWPPALRNGRIYNALKEEGQQLPGYILTPKPSPKPRINGAKVFGVRPGNPFLFTIAATGDRPMTFSARGLPAGLQLDTQSGHITGTLKE